MQLNTYFLAAGIGTFLFAMTTTSPQKDPCASKNPPPWCGTPVPSPTAPATATPTRPPATPTPGPTTPPGAFWDLVVPVPKDYFSTGPDGYLWIAGQNRPFRVTLRKPDGTCISVQLAVPTVAPAPVPRPNIIASR